jgi:hypothetical protein
MVNFYKTTRHDIPEDSQLENSLVSKLTGYGLDYWPQSPAEEKIFHFATMSRPGLGIMQPHIQ